MEEEEIVDRPISPDELRQYLSDKFDLPRGPIVRKKTVAEMFADLKNRR